jgi:isocitrate dehydrogenase
MITLFKSGFRTVDLADKNTGKEKILSTSNFGDRVSEYIKKA